MGVCCWQTLHQSPGFACGSRSLLKRDVRDQQPRILQGHRRPLGLEQIQALVRSSPEAELQLRFTTGSRNAILISRSPAVLTVSR